MIDSLYFSVFCIFFFKQKTAYEMRISDWSSDVCSSDLCLRQRAERSPTGTTGRRASPPSTARGRAPATNTCRPGTATTSMPAAPTTRSEEHTSELQSLMRISYAVFCLKKKKIDTTQ